MITRNNTFKILLTSVLLTFLACCSVSYGQEKAEEEFPRSEYKPLILKTSEDGEKYIRFILWNQFWLENDDIGSSNGYNMRIRRSRVLAYAQISPRFLILTHFGMNSLDATTMDPIGNRATNDPTVNGPQLFLHAAWSEFKVNSHLSVGGGLHYWNGLTRMTSSSTLNFMTLDNHRQSWAQLGLSDQFGRHLGIYVKGKVRRMSYTLALNEAIENALGSDLLENLEEGSITYSGRKVFGNTAQLVLTGRLEYQLLDPESNKLPYRVGSYLGQKRILNIGAGFFNHRNGVVKIENGPIGYDVNHFTADVFYDAPVGKGAINAYASVINLGYGPGYYLGNTYGTGQSYYLQAGYLLPFTTPQGRLMPYLSYSRNDFEAFDYAGEQWRIGANWFINGHNAKLTLEYSNILPNYSQGDNKPSPTNGLVLQTHIFL